MKPEEAARELIDAKLKEAGCCVQSYDQMNLVARTGLSGPNSLAYAIIEDSKTPLINPPQSLVEEPMTMGRLQRSYYRLKAESRFREDKRQGFQAWIGKAFELAHLRDYDDIRLTQGDGGLDGIIINEGAVVAVYAPGP